MEWVQGGGIGGEASHWILSNFLQPLYPLSRRGLMAGWEDLNLLPLLNLPNLPLYGGYMDTACRSCTQWLSRPWPAMNGDGGGKGNCLLLSQVFNTCSWVLTTLTGSSSSMSYQESFLSQMPTSGIRTFSVPNMCCTMRIFCYSLFVLLHP